MKAKIIGLSLLIATIGLTSSTFAQDSKFAQTHPRRAEVNSRLKNQNNRIHKEVKEGELSKQQAANLHRKDKSIRTEERNMAARDGGHLTKKDQAKLNHRENNVSKQIGQ
ncbi:hypothetical protein [Pedobacter cryoconitis]|uniref:Uncharacterized protein n=1 Tax=Pedobacter cryoconitis TaxID=188932 RepID=A0A7X0IZU6_9SPHI|nr:hypothetical protein [Pedobacter cryoconitis]MBB6498218.1 hypothetical protein [Pedobacter cryoconitis]